MLSIVKIFHNSIRVYNKAVSKKCFNVKLNCYLIAILVYLALWHHIRPSVFDANSTGLVIDNIIITIAVTFLYYDFYYFKKEKTVRSGILK